MKRTRQLVLWLSLGLAVSACPREGAKNSGELEPEGEAAAVEAAPPPVEIDFAFRGPREGEAYQVVDRYKVSREWTGSSQGVGVLEESSSASGVDERVETVVQWGLRTRVVHVDYRLARHRIESGESAEAEVTTSPVSGKSFEVSWDGEALSIQRDDAEVPADEMATVLDDLGWVANRPDAAFLPELNGRRLLEGAELAVGEEAISRLVGQVLPGFQATSYDIQLAGVREVDGQASGVFGVKMQLVSQAGGLQETADARGELVVRAADCRVLSLRLKGPTRVSGRVNSKGGSSLAAEGQGQVEGSRTVAGGSIAAE